MPGWSKREAAAGAQPRELFAIIRASGPCVYCGAAAETVDHLTPVLRGGTHDEANLVPSCRHCNVSKGNRLLTRWRRDRVAYALAGSSKVATAYAEHARLEAEVLAQCSPP